MIDSFSIQSGKVPKKDWERLGLMVPKPQYEFGEYYTNKCQPVASETQLFGGLIQRQPIIVKDILPLITVEKDAKSLKSEKGMIKYIQVGALICCNCCIKCKYYLTWNSLILTV